MIKLSILAFGITKDIIGSSNVELNLPAGSTVQDLRNMLTAQYPALCDLTSILIAINNEYSSNETLLVEKDEIALIPPVSGG